MRPDQEASERHSDLWGKPLIPSLPLRVLTRYLMVNFFFIIGTHFFSWGSERAEQMRCGKCGTVATFIKKEGMRFITLFFIIPVIPISGVTHLLQCPACGTKYQTNS